LNIVWTTAARDDRRAIYSYIEEHDPETALRLDELFSTRIGRLARFPLMGRPGRVEDTRELVVHPNYIAIYRVVADEVRIIRILHTALRWPLIDDD
jgi:toxin ParE1/3/4